MSQHPELFDHNRIEAEPPITAFQPRYAYNRDNVTLELLENLGEISKHEQLYDVILFQYQTSK